MTAVAIDRERLVETASAMIDVHSFTGDEEPMADLMVSLYEQMGLRVHWQQVEDGRANTLGTWSGTGGGKTLMFNGHMDTSYSGREPWLKDVPGFQPTAFVKNGRLYGLGISNMKGALACYVEAVRALQDAGVKLRGDILIAAVCGEIEKTQFAEAQGAQYRGYAAGSRYLVTHGGEGRPRPLRLAVAAHSHTWQLHPHCLQRGQARRELDPAHPRSDRRGSRMDSHLGERPCERLPRRKGNRQRGRGARRLRLARVADAAPHRPVSRRARPTDEADGGRAARGARLRSHAGRALP
jgi:hypothetical protein